MYRLMIVVALCLAPLGCDLQADVDEDGEVIGEDDSASTAAPHFIKNRWSWSCLDLPGGNSANRTPINQYWRCHGGGNQQFTKLNGRDYLGNPGTILYHAPTGKCVTIDGSPSVASKIFLYTCSISPHTATNQLFELRATGSSWRSQSLYEIRAPWYPNKCMDVPGPTLANGIQMQMYPCHGGQNQQWNVSYTYNDPS